MTAVGVKCIFCGICLRETELSGHLSGYHNIRSLLLRPNQSSAATQIDPEDRCYIYGQKKYIEPDLSESEADSVGGDISGGFETDLEICSRFRCSACSFVHESYSRVKTHILTNHKSSRRRYQRTPDHLPLPQRQEMFVRLEDLHLPANINQDQSQPESGPLVHSTAGRRGRGRPRKGRKYRDQTGEKTRRRTRLSTLELERGPRPRTTRKRILNRDNKEKASKLKKGRSRTRKQVASVGSKSGNLGKCIEDKVSTVPEVQNEKQNLLASGDEDEDIVNVLDKLIQEAEQETATTGDDMESGSNHDNTLEELDLDCIILEEVNSTNPPPPLSDTEERELKFILETSSPGHSHDTAPGPSRPYQCPYCPSKYDTALEVHSHVAVCRAQVRVSDDDSSSLSTGTFRTVKTPPVELASNTSRNIKTDNVSDIKSSVTNVYIRFVQTYYSTYKRKFPHLNSADLMEKLLESYKVMRTIDHPCIRTLQEDYERERKEIYNQKIKAIVRSLEEDDSASFSPIKSLRS